MKELPNDDNAEKEREYEQVNETVSIWNKNKSEVKEEEYKLILNLFLLMYNIFKSIVRITLKAK